MSDFYRERDRMDGGTNSEWADAANFAQWHQALDDAQGADGQIDMRADDNDRFSGVLSQSELAG